MTAFLIDTGVPDRHSAAGWRIDRCDGLINGALDSLPENPTQAQIDAAIIAAVLGDLKTPKRAETVRRHLVQLWPAIMPLAVTDPAGFDAVLMEYAEIITTLG